MDTVAAPSASCCSWQVEGRLPVVVAVAPVPVSCSFLPQRPCLRLPAASTPSTSHFFAAPSGKAFVGCGRVEGVDNSLLFLSAFCCVPLCSFRVSPTKNKKKLSTVYMYPKTPSLRALVRRQPQVYGRQSRCLCAYTESWSVWSIRAMSKAQNFSTRPWALTLCRSEMKAG